MQGMVPSRIVSHALILLSFPTETFEMRKISIKQIPVGPFQVLTYLVACLQTRHSVIIDPAGDEDKLLTLIQTEGLRVKYILNTHGHADHVLGNPYITDFILEL